MNKYIFIGISFIGIILILTFSVENFGIKNNIWIECEAADTITKPIEIIKMEGASEGKALVANGFQHIHKGYALYNIKGFQKENYSFWIRGYWPLVCSNSYHLKLGNGEFIPIGNTSIMRKWHWIKGPILNFEKSNQLAIWNDENDSKIDKILLTTDPNFIPTGIGESNDLYFDFENLNISGFNFENDRNWQIVKDEYLTNNYLYLKSVKKKEQAVIDVSKAENFVFQVAVRLKSKTEANVLFNYLNDNNYYSVNININRIQLVKKNNGGLVILKEVNLSGTLDNSILTGLMIIRSKDKIIIKVNGSTIISSHDKNFFNGEVGIGSNTGDIFFDNIAYMTELEPYHTDEYHQVNLFYCTNNVPETNHEYLKNLNHSSIYYWHIDGEWEYDRSGIESFKGIKTTDRDALILFGHPYWEDYSFRSAVQAPIDGKGMGICFNVQDTGNYYLFRWEGEDCKKGIELLKKENGKWHVLSSQQKTIKRGQWYRFLVKRKEDSIYIYLDDDLIMNTKDTTFIDGRIGYWTNSSTGAYFDDIMLSKTKTLENIVDRSIKYVFHTDGNVGYSLAGWEFEKPDIIKSYNYNNMIYSNWIFLSKMKDECTYVWHKKKISKYFKLYWRINNKNVPEDVNVVFNFKNPIESFKVIVDNSEIRLFKNNKMVAKNNYEGSRGKINIGYFKKSTWGVAIGDKVYLKYEDSVSDNEFKFNFGFEGKGAANIDLNEIEIKQN